MKLLNGPAIVATIVAAVLGTLLLTSAKPKARHSSETPIYIQNFAQRYISDATIKHDIPAWEEAVNHDFSHYWYGTQYKLVFVGRKGVPTGNLSAEFVDKGNVKGALAYHTTNHNAPHIVVYAGTDDYYGFSNSVSFTHELFELAADPYVSSLAVGYPDDYIVLEKKSGRLSVQPNVAEAWVQEVCDPVEADSYSINGVAISDFVTPAWFNLGIGSRYDFLGLTQQPFWLRPGGYAQFLSPFGFSIVTNWRSDRDKAFAKLYN